MKSFKRSCRFIVLFFAFIIIGLPVKAANTDGFDKAIPLVYDQPAKGIMTPEQTDKIIYKITMTSKEKMNFMINSSAALDVGIYYSNGSKLDYMNSFYYASLDSPQTGYFNQTVMPGDYYIVIENWFESSGEYTILWGDFSVKSISLNYTDLTLDLDNSDIIMEATALPEIAYNKKIEWSSSNKDIVYIYPNGRISPQACGQATITATAQDGSGVTASCTVTVKPSAPDDLKVSDDTDVKTTSFEVKWDSVKGATGYKVYLYDKKSKQYKLYATTNKTKCKIKKLKAETAYNIQVSAYLNLSSGTLESARSETLKQYTAPKTLGKTKIKSVKKGGRLNTANGTYYKFTVSWKKVKGATGYVIYGKIIGQTGLKRMGTTKKTKEGFYAGYGYKYNIIVVPYRKKHGSTTYGKKSSPAVLDLTH